jgi:hypothetical protein
MVGVCNIMKNAYIILITYLKGTDHIGSMDVYGRGSSLTVRGTVAAFVPCSVVVFSVLTRWNGVSKLIFRKKSLNLQNYLITIANNNNNKKIRPKPLR